MHEILIWGSYVYGLSILGTIIILFCDHKFSKYPDYYNYITIILLGLIPILNTLIVLDTIRINIFKILKNIFTILRNDNKSKKTKYVVNYDSTSMYPNICKLENENVVNNELHSSKQIKNNKEKNMKRIVEYIKIEDTKMDFASIAMKLGEINIPENTYFEESDNYSHQIHVSTDDILNIMTFKEFNNIFKLNIDDLHVVDFIIFYSGMTIRAIDDIEKETGVKDKIKVPNDVFLNKTISENEQKLELMLMNNEISIVDVLKIANIDIEKVVKELTTRRTKHESNL